MKNLTDGWYMASTTNISEDYDSTMGVIQSAGFYMKKNGEKRGQGVYRKRLDRGCFWCLDNGVFTNRFDPDFWEFRLEEMSGYKDTCSFVSIPDVVGDFEKTVERFHIYKSKVFDYPKAFVSQDGILNNQDLIPWDEFEVLFVGGSDEHKLGKEGMWAITEAKKRNKRVHIGRVNSKKRILNFWMADSWDGTKLGFEPSYVEKFHNAVLEARKIKESLKNEEK